MPIDPAEPIDRIEPTDPIERMDPAEPIDRIEPAEPIAPTEPIEPIEPIDPDDPMLATDRVDPMLATDRSDPMEVASPPSPSILPGSGLSSSRTVMLTRPTWVVLSTASVVAMDRTLTGRRRLASRPLAAATGGVASAVVAAVTAPVLRKALRGKSPGVALERELWDSGHRAVVGVDEVGRGAWAGPLSVGAAVLPSDRRVYKVRDSKMLTEPEREALFDRIAGWCVTWSVGHATQTECDELGMSAAQRLAAERAIAGLDVEPDRVLVDGRWDFVGGGNTRRVVGGDATCLSISAASILAKVTRDRMMRAEAPNFPGYDFDRNKGYPCPRHKAALQGWGPTSIHRRSWVFMDHLCWSGVRRVRPPDPQGSLFAEEGVEAS